MALGTLGQYVESQADEGFRALLEGQIARASVLSGRASFDEVEIGSVAEMGEAAGTCDMCTGEILLREDIVASEEMVRSELARVLVHEAEHAEGNGSEGFTSVAEQLLTGEAPVPAYRAKAEHARHVLSVVGEQRGLDLIREEGGEVIVLQEYVAARVKSGIDAQVATREGEEHIRLAA